MDNSALLPDLYPAIAPYAAGMLGVGDGHTLYWEQSGNPDGIPALFVHGGPGAGCGPQHRRFFDPERYRIVLFDQRGAGKSTPYAAIADNTTDRLIADIEALRRHLGCEGWLVFGGSWGSTLALAYAIAHPRRCLGLILRGIFLGSRGEIDWFMHSMGTIFPEARRAFLGFLGANERDDPLAAYFRRLSDPDPAIHMPAAQAWNAFEGACSTLLPGRAPGAGASLALARIEAHYFRGDMFLAPGHILGHIDRLEGIPAAIVQGRYDIVCPIVTADLLAGRWPGGAGALRYTVVEDAGHSAMEPGIRRALVEAADIMGAKLRAAGV